MKTKRFFSTLLTLVILFGTFIFPVTAEENIKVILNGKELTFDVKPQIIDDRTMVPMRVIFETLGADVHWIDMPNDFQMILAIKNEIKILMVIDEEKFYKLVGNDFAEFSEFSDKMQPIELDVPPQLIDGRTLVPLRAVSEALGVEVIWEETTQTVTLTCDEEFIKNTNTDKTFYDELVKYMEDEEDLQQRVYVDINTHADMMIISSENENPQKSYVITNKKEIENFLSTYQWRDWHLPCCWGGGDPDYTIKSIYEGVVKETIVFKDDWTGTPYNAEFGDKLNNYISDFKNKDDFSYQYIFYAKNSIDFRELKQNIENITYLPNDSINATKPYIELSYIAVAQDEEEWDKAFYGDNKIGEFSYDDYFIPFINELEDKGLYFDNGDVSFASGNGLNFARRVKIFLTRSLTENEITEIKEKAKEIHIIGEPQGFHPVTYFLYQEAEEYEMKVIFDKEQSSEELRSFCKKYNLDNFDYDKELLDFDTMTIYLLKKIVSPNELNPTDCKSIVITKDLDLIYKQHEPVSFVPFKDEDPPFSIIEQRKISEDDLQTIRKIISNYNILSISDNLGVGGYEFDRFCYIGIQIDDRLYVCGGQDDYSDNQRFFNIRSKILRLLNIDF